MFLVIPFVEFLHVLGVDINVHHENPATFLCHMSVSSVKSSRHRFASSRWHPDLTPGPRRDTRHQLGSHLSFKVRFTPRLQVRNGLPYGCLLTSKLLRPLSAPRPRCHATRRGRFTPRARSPHPDTGSGLPAPTPAL